MTNSLVVFCLSLALVAIANAEEFSLTKNQSDLIIEGNYLTKENNYGKEFWICVDYESATPLNDPLYGDVYPTEKCGGELHTTENAYWYVVHGTWESDDRLYMEFEPKFHLYPNGETGGSRGFGSGAFQWTQNNLKASDGTPNNQLWLKQTHGITNYWTKRPDIDTLGLWNAGSVHVRAVKDGSEIHVRVSGGGGLQIEKIYETEYESTETTSTTTTTTEGPISSEEAVTEPSPAKDSAEADFLRVAGEHRAKEERPEIVEGVPASTAAATTTTTQPSPSDNDQVATEPSEEKAAETVTDGPSPPQIQWRLVDSEPAEQVHENREEESATPNTMELRRLFLSLRPSDENRRDEKMDFGGRAAFRAFPQYSDLFRQDMPFENFSPSAFEDDQQQQQSGGVAIIIPAVFVEHRPAEGRSPFNFEDEIPEEQDPKLSGQQDDQSNSSDTTQTDSDTPKADETTIEQSTVVDESLRSVPEERESEVSKLREFLRLHPQYVVQREERAEYNYQFLYTVAVGTAFAFLFFFIAIVLFRFFSMGSSANEKPMGDLPKHQHVIYTISAANPSTYPVKVQTT